MSEGCVNKLMWNRSSHTNVRSFLSAFASLMSWVMALVCYTQPEKPGTPPFWTKVLMYLLAVRKIVDRLARSANNTFPSTFRSDIVRNWSIVLEFSSFVVNIPSASFQASGTIPFPQTTFSNLHSRLNSLSVLELTRYLRFNCQSSRLSFSIRTCRLFGF